MRLQIAIERTLNRPYLQKEEALLDDEEKILNAIRLLLNILKLSPFKKELVVKVNGEILNAYLEAYSRAVFVAEKRGEKVIDDRTLIVIPQMLLNKDGSMEFEINDDANDPEIKFLYWKKI